MNSQRDYEVRKILEFLRQSELNQKEGISPSHKGLSYILSHIGRLFVKEYRIIQFLPHKLILFSRSLIYNHSQRQYILMRILPKNKLKEDREFRLKIYEKLSKTIVNLPFKGIYRALILYIDNFSYSFLSANQLETTAAPIVHQMKHIQFFDQPVIHSRKREIDCKHAGTLLHSLVQFYISGSGWVSNESIIKQLHSSRMNYSPPKAIHTVNYIIGLQMIKGGYEMMATEKLLQTTNLLLDERTCFNRLDLVLRNEDKVLVIDWKFSIQRAREYMKGYRAKVQKYLRLVKKYYRCEVEFHLYCIHRKDNGFLYEFSTQAIHKRIASVDIQDGFQDDDDVEVIEGAPFTASSREESKADDRSEEPIRFHLSDKQASEVCADYNLGEQIDGQLAQQQIAEQALKQGQQADYGRSGAVVDVEYKNALGLENHKQIQFYEFALTASTGLEMNIYTHPNNTEALTQKSEIPTKGLSPEESTRNKSRVTLAGVIQMLSSEEIGFQNSVVGKGVQTNKAQLGRKEMMKGKQRVNYSEENSKQHHGGRLSQKSLIFIDLEQPILIEED